MHASHPPLLSRMVSALHAAKDDLQLVREAFPLLVNEHAYWTSEPKLVHVRMPTCSAYHTIYITCQLPPNDLLLDKPRNPAGGAAANCADSMHIPFSCVCCTSCIMGICFQGPVLSIPSTLINP